VVIEGGTTEFGAFFFGVGRGLGHGVSPGAISRTAWSGRQLL
jgi:hypothetical protein